MQWVRTVGRQGKFLLVLLAHEAAVQRVREEGKRCRRPASNWGDLWNLMAVNQSVHNNALLNT